MPTQMRSLLSSGFVRVVPALAVSAIFLNPCQRVCRSLFCLAMPAGRLTLQADAAQAGVATPAVRMPGDGKILKMDYLAVSMIRTS